MKKSSLKKAVEDAKLEMQIALQVIIDELNRGQQKKIIKNAEIKALLDRYGVSYTE